MYNFMMFQFSMNIYINIFKCYFFTYISPTLSLTLTDHVTQDEPIFVRSNAIVLPLIYGIISADLLLNIILEPDSTAQQACERLQNIF